MKKRVGRPPLPAHQRKNRFLKFRARSNLRSLLVRAARKSEWSVSEEIERRLEKSFENENAG